MDEQRLWLDVILEAVIVSTGSHGKPEDQQIIQSYTQNPQGATSNDFFEVCGIELADFYAFSGTAFDNDKANLWRTIQDASQRNQASPSGWAQSMPVPPSLSINTNLSQVALYVQAWADSASGSAANGGASDDAAAGGKE